MRDGSTHGTLLAARAVYETFAICAPTVLEAAVGRARLDVCDARLARWSRRLLDQAGVRLTVSGREQLDPHRPYVVMSNHASHYDVPLLFQAYPGRLRMVAKTELFRVPVFGPALTASGFIEIDRKDRARAIESLRVARTRLEQGISVWIAPEGTRSRDGTLGAFKKGGFLLALETALPVVPTAVLGSDAILPTGARSVRAGARVHVAFGEPVHPDRSASLPEARNALMEQVRVAITRGLATAREAIARE